MACKMKFAKPKAAYAKAKAETKHKGKSKGVKKPWASSEFGRLSRGGWRQ